MLEFRVSIAVGQCAFGNYQVGLARCKSFNRQDEEEEEKRENGKAFGRSSLFQCERVQHLNGRPLDPLAYHHTVISCKYRKLVQSSYKIPTSSDVASDKDTEGEDGERVHKCSTFTS